MAESAGPQRSLGDYAAGDLLADIELPDRGVEWQAEPVTTPTELQILSFDDRFEYPDGYLGSNVAGFVIGDVTEYLVEYGEEVLPLPPSYTRFDEFDPYVTRVSCSGSGYGFGITADRLEAGLRFATGGGRYSTGEITATVCEGNSPLIIRAPAGDFAISPTTIRGKPEGFEAGTETVAGISIPEHDEVMLTGIEQLFDELRKHFDIEVTEHVKRTSSGHEFATGSGGSVAASANTFRAVQRAAPEAEILDRHEYETLWGETFAYEPTPDDFRERVGEQQFSGICIGHQVGWDDPRIGSRFGTDRPVRFEIRSYYLDLTDGERPKARITDSTRRVEAFETDGDGTGDPIAP